MSRPEARKEGAASGSPPSSSHTCGDIPYPSLPNVSVLAEVFRASYEPQRVSLRSSIGPNTAKVQKFGACPKVVTQCLHTVHRLDA